MGYRGCAIFVLGLLAWGCEEKNGSAPPLPLSPDGSATSQASALATGEISGAPKTGKDGKVKEEPPSEDALKRYHKHLAEGRRLAAKSKWAESVAEFELALAAYPKDARVLTELGWVAFLGGDLVKGKSANEEALKYTNNPILRAMALYNLGRVAEEQGDLGRAQELYAESLTLRPNNTVEKRLSSLKLPPGKLGAPANDDAVHQAPSCMTKTLDDLCTCLTKRASGSPDQKQTCEVAHEPKITRDDLKIVRVDEDFATSTYHLAFKNEQGWAAVAEFQPINNPGAFGVFEEFSVVSVLQKSAGSTDVLWIETQTERHDTDMGIDEYEQERTLLVTLCVIPSDKTKVMNCRLQVPVETEYTRERLNLAGFTPDETTKYLMTPGLPVRTSTKLRVELLKDSTAKVSLVTGKLGAAVKKLVGTHRL